MASGLRVIRGPGWAMGDSDGGEGHVGTIVALRADGAVQVTWDGGQHVTVKDGTKELRVLDNATIGIMHSGYACDECQDSNIVGMRWRCSECDDYDLCSLCYFNDSHDRNHQFLRFETPESTPVKMDKRTKSLKMRVMGIFPEATVKRGRDWEEGNEDGGASAEGLVTDLEAPSTTSARSTVRVTWSSGQSGVYRLGYLGKVDLQYVEEAPGGECYPQHLPFFDAKTYKDRVAPSDSELKEGDRIYIDLRSDKVQELRQARSDIVQLVGRIGEVKGKNFL